MTRGRIHVFGASGSGTTTLARAVADRAGIAHLDTDDFYWEPTDPPFRVKRDVAERVRLLSAAMEGAGAAWVLSGSLAGWGDVLAPRFQLAVFLSLDPAERLRRLRARERSRYGERLSTDLAAAHAEFMAWAARYDAGGAEVRSRALHERWMATTLACPVLRLDAALPVPRLAAAVLDAAA